MTGRLELPKSNLLPELIRVLRIFNRRVESLESNRQGVDSAAQTSKASSTLSTPGAGSASSGGSTTTPQVAETVTVEFMTYQAPQIDPEDGLVAVDEDGYAKFQAATVPFQAQPLNAVNVAIPVGGGTFAWNVPAGFDGATSFVNLLGAIASPLRLETSLGGQQVVFRNGTTGGEEGTLTLALSNQTPPDSGILVPRNGLAWVQSNAAGTALEVVASYA